MSSPDRKSNESTRHSIGRRLRTRSLMHNVAAGRREHPELGPVAGGVPEAKVVGINPMRALIFGSGMALGYGVSSHDQALTGHLARAIAARTGRGAVVQTRAVPRQFLDKAMAELGLVGAHLFDLVVWCPSLFELSTSPARGRLHQTLTEALPFLRETAGPDAVIVVTLLPQPTNRGPFEEIARRRVSRFNRSLARTVSAYPDIRIAQAPSFTTLNDPAAFSAAYYAEFADRILTTESSEAERSA